jgi:Concanavalin A-like lectin/glucanases superfamily
MTRPSFADYGTYDESAHPDLWDGVVGYWAPCLGPTGTRLHDVSRYNNWGTLTNMDAATDWVIDGGQYALDFDGVNDHVAATSAAAALTLPFTVAVWYYPRVRQNYMGIVSTMTRFQELDTDGWCLYDNANAVAGRIGAICGGQLLVVDPQQSALNQWQQYVVTYGGANSAIYRNGVLMASGSMGTPSYAATPVVKIGSFITTSGPNTGLIDDIVLFRRKLQPNEIRRLYNLGRGGMLERRRRRRVYSVQDTGNRRRRIICGAEC